MKLFVLITLGLFFIAVFGCETSKECKEKEEPICALPILSTTKKCVQCASHVDCSIDSYCSLDLSCRKFSNDNVLGKFCNDDGADWEDKDIDDYHACGYYSELVGTWKGVCIDNKCEECIVGNPSSGIAAYHNYVQCYPKKAGSAAGVVRHQKQPPLYPHIGTTPGFFIQSSFSMGMCSIGFILVAIIVMTFLTMKRRK
ncbi:hypothetical protein M0812_17121 [Anaeramoeba flamelloides]|uniref:Uncharacterized protein n=1 Tax=Anaeramoeba flamelloides TaxID=1746091 RepID=A0AAV7ZCL0_9EUKA|nr:hypothetical protein M0812_17121 [Anaeramoeba flamelloides]|eukprot:Anaeramoba_flamelloidesa813767_110.p1 GENE.a813767_110~~a813767_110.p1  ORF type:complete len:199 (+),score=20.01 a813767_110:30-626(+)